MSVRTIAICDWCAAELEFRTDGPMDASEYARRLNAAGWHQRTDAIRDVCARHPRPVTP